MLRILAASLLLFALGCPEGENAPVSVAFRAVVGTEPYACGSTYPGVGTAPSDLIVRDFRMYVHDVSLVRTDGVAVPIALDDSSAYQHAGVAFLDFSAGAGADCDDPTAETNGIVSGLISEGTYNGISFTVGIPFEINHANNATAPAPLNVTSMYWDWFAGYKFVRVDGATVGGTAVLLHLGSTACTPDGMGSVGSCANENRPAVTLPTFNPEGHAVVVDLAALFAGSDLEASAGTATGCMAEPDDADCGPMFGALGLPFDGTPGPAQTVFRVEAR